MEPGELAIGNSVNCSKGRALDTRISLPKNAVLDGSYCIERVIGSGGFGVTYLAEDLHLKTTIAIKEYYPVDFGDRDASMRVQPRSERLRGTFEWGRTSFLNEAQTLARFRHPSIVRITRAFEVHGTAYMVMDYERGQNFEAWLAGLGRAPMQAELDRIAAPLLDALEMLHAESILHRDIAPDNVIVRPDGTPVLLDFGAARQAVAHMSRSLTRITKPGYSPHEQYALDTRLQGPWSDLYAFGATLYRAITGGPPPEATVRAGDDRMVPAALAGKAAYRPGFLDAIDLCLKVPNRERPQSVAQLRPLLLDTPASGRTEASRRIQAERNRGAPGLARGMGIAVAVAALLAGGYGVYHYAQRESPAVRPAPDTMSTADTAAKSSSDASNAPGRDSDRTIAADVEAQRKAEFERRAAAEAETQRKEEERKPTPEQTLAPDSGATKSATAAPVVKDAPSAPPVVADYDGAWTFTRTISERCGPGGSIFTVIVTNGVVHAPGGKGSVSPSGQVKFPGKSNYFTGTLSERTGRGTFGGRCTGTFTARRK